MDSLALNSEDGLLYWLVSKASLVVAAKVTCTVELCYKTTLVNRDVEEDTNQLVSYFTFYCLAGNVFIMLILARSMIRLHAVYIE